MVHNLACCRYLHIEDWMDVNDMSYDIAIIGGGIIGLSTAMQLSEKHPQNKIIVIEKEDSLANHQTGHNSGVIHSGIYYKPGSLKAYNCVTGSRDLMKFCDINNIRYELCGKVIVATNEKELKALQTLHERGIANGVQGLRILDPAELKEIEPHALGLKGLYSPNTGIIDYVEVTKAYGLNFQANGGDILTNTKVTAIRQADGRFYLQTDHREILATYVINCAGLYSDKVAAMLGVRDTTRIIPFRGEYYMLTPDARQLVNGLIYPVPNPEFPFLGVHFTKTIHGDVEAGPNAVFAFAREGYTTSTINIRETFETMTFKGFWAMSARYWSRGLQEFYRSLSKQAFLRSLQTLVPDIREHHLVKGGAGVRAQEVESNGLLADDFHITQTQNAIHVRNAPSPGATASLAIGKSIVGIATDSFGLT